MVVAAPLRVSTGKLPTQGSKRMWWQCLCVILQILEDLVGNLRKTAVTLPLSPGSFGFGLRITCPVHGIVGRTFYHNQKQAPKVATMILNALGKKHCISLFRGGKSGRAGSGRGGRFRGSTMKRYPMFNFGPFLSTPYEEYALNTFSTFTSFLSNQQFFRCCFFFQKVSKSNTTLQFSFFGHAFQLHVRSQYCILPHFGPLWGECALDTFSLITSFGSNFQISPVANIFSSRCQNRTPCSISYLLSGRTQN